MRVIQLGDPILRKQSDYISVKDIASKEVTSVINRLQSIMKGLKQISPRNGNGIAGPQVRYLKRLIMMFFDNNFHTMINPEITERSDDTFNSPEACLSFYYLRAPVIRNKSIIVKYINEQGKEMSKEFTSVLSALVQHEIDHLDGTLYIDRVEQISDIDTIYHLFRDDSDRLLKIIKIIHYLTETENA